MVATAFDGMASQRKVVFRHNIDPAIPPAIAGDALRVRQILSNLISNAIKFSSDLDHPGEVALNARLVEANEAGDDRVWIEIDVCDNGIGMDEATLDRVFHPFTQADASTTRKYGGTGLGLVISRRLTEMMGGVIRVDSTPGVGSTFTVQLPFARVNERQLALAFDTAAAIEPVVRSSSLGKLAGRILVAEDNMTNQEVIRHQLDLLGYRSDITSDGREAFRHWLEGDYALVITDIHMPNMDGYQLAAAIRTEESRGDADRTPIVALTANALKGEAERCKVAGMDDYLAKPLQLSQLQASLEKWLPADAGNAAPDIVAASGGPAVPSGSGLPVFDPEMLTKMVGGNPDLHRRLLDKFLANAQDRITTLHNAADAGDISTAEQIAHSLKSAARSVGAMQLGDLCEQIEKAGKAGDLDSLRAQLPSIISAFETADSAISKTMKA